MIDHISTYANNFIDTKNFYKTVLLPLGYFLQAELSIAAEEGIPEHSICAFGPQGKTIFWIIETQKAYTPRHIAFSANSQHSVDDFYQKAIESGGKCHGAPGLRPAYHQHYYAAFVIDPDGNDIEAVYHHAELLPSAI